MALAAVLVAATAAACDHDSDTVGTADPTGPALPVQAEVSNSAQVTTYRTGGNWADLTWSEGNTFGYLAVSWSAAADTEATYLEYFVATCSEFDCELRQAGYGPINAAGLDGSVVKGFHLATSTSANSGFVIYAGTGGTIGVTWKATPFYQAVQRSAGGGSSSQECSFPGVKVSYTTAGSTTSTAVRSTAVATGSIGGITLATGAVGDMGSNADGYRQVTVSRTRE